MNRFARLFAVLLCVFLLSGCEKEKTAVSKRAGKKRAQKAQEKETPKESISEESQLPDVESRSNPFLSREEEEISKKQDFRRPLDLNLTAIVYTPAQKRAVIDGRIYKEGDIVDNKEIVKINAEEIILKDSQGEYVIRLKGILNSAFQSNK